MVQVILVNDLGLLYRLNYNRQKKSVKCNKTKQLMIIVVLVVAWGGLSHGDNILNVYCFTFSRETTLGEHAIKRTQAPTNRDIRCGRVPLSASLRGWKSAG